MNKESLFKLDTKTINIDDPNNSEAKYNFTISKLTVKEAYDAEAKRVKNKALENLTGEKMEISIQDYFNHQVLYIYYGVVNSEGNKYFTKDEVESLSPAIFEKLYEKIVEFNEPKK